MGANQGKIDYDVYGSIAKYTELKKEDILAWQDRFSQKCDSGSTTMNKEQFCKFYQQLRPNENVKRLSENVFRAFDLNGDHGISFNEVCSHLNSLKKRSNYISCHLICSSNLFRETLSSFFCCCLLRYITMRL